MLTTSPKKYKKALGILGDCSQHIELIAEAIKTQVLPKLQKRNSMLDVGAGIGILTKLLRDEFRDVTVLDINPKVESELKSNNYDVHICDFLNFKTDKKYDLVLCSHVMYGLDETQMSLFIDKLHTLTNAGGYCFIALIAPLGANHEFHKQYDPKYINSTNIIEILQKKQIPFNVTEATPHHITTPDQNTMKSLLKFFLQVNCQRNPHYSQEQDKVEKTRLAVEATKKCKRENGLFDIAQTDHYIDIQGKSRFGL